MSIYLYTAKKNTAETVTGQIKAQDEDEAIDLINQLGLLPVSIEERQMDDVSLGKPQKIKNKELYIFSRQLSNLLKAGVSLLRALSILEQQTQNAYFRKVINHLGTNIKNGSSFSDSLEEFPLIFSSLYVTMVRAGEQGGRLQETLLNVANHQSKQAQMLLKIRNAITYPCIMAVLGIITVYFMLTFVLPRMTGLFSNMGSALPWPTAALIWVSTALSKGWIWLFAGIAFMVVLSKRWRKTPHGRYFISRFLLRIPVLGEIILKTELARFCRTFLMLLKSGITVISALQIAIPVLHNEILKKRLTKSKDILIQGGSFGESIKNSKDLPAMMGHLVAVGEESGNLEEVLVEIADTYEQETNELMKIMTTILEPLMIITIGLVVGFIVFAMLLPIFEIDVLSR